MAKFWYFAGSSPTPGEIVTGWPNCFVQLGLHEREDDAGNGAVPCAGTRLSIVIGLRSAWSQLKAL